MIVVSDATPLIALARIGRLDLLRELFDAILIPEAVHEEVVARSPGRSGASEVGQAEWIRRQVPADRRRVNYLRADLDWGEAEALVLAEEVAADWVLVDEPKARLAAELLGLRFMGTVGVLLLAKRLGKISAVRPVLDELRARKFRLSERVYSAVLAEAGE